MKVLRDIKSRNVTTVERTGAVTYTARTYDPDGNLLKETKGPAIAIGLEHNAFRSELLSDKDAEIALEPVRQRQAYDPTVIDLGNIPVTPTDDGDD